MSKNETLDLFWIAAAWLAYGLLHSTLASLRVKAWVARTAPTLFQYYRLIYNAIAVVAALPILWLIKQADGPDLLHWSGPWHWLALSLSLAAGTGFIISLRAYDMREFVGLRQMHERSGDLREQAGFRISFFHRFVRHPWYFFALVILWTQDMHAAMLVSALALSAYFVIGTRFEEHKLIAAYGERYRRYMARVPALLPLPWKFLTKEEAAQITDETSAASR